MPESRFPLSNISVVDLSSGIAGGYCTKNLADGGADVIKLEDPGGDPLRAWSIGGPVAPDRDGPLFEFLGCSKKSVVLHPDSRSDLDWALRAIEATDVVVWSRGSALASHPELSPDALRQTAPQAVVAAITGFGLKGPWSDLAYSDLTLQAWAGGIFARGAPERPPVQIGGRLSPWLGGLFASVGILTARQRSSATGHGELIDVSILESLIVTEQMYGLTRQTMPAPGKDRSSIRMPSRSLLIPAIYATKDSWVGFMVATATMWESFCIMVEHPEWIEDVRLYAYAGRLQRYDELEEATTKWCAERTTTQVLEMAELLRVPAAPVGDGRTVPAFDHLQEGNFYLPNPRSGLLQPDVAYSLGGSRRRLPEPPPRLGEHTNSEMSKTPLLEQSHFRAPGARDKVDLPFEGMRVADFTAFWAGPVVGHFLAQFGAEVIHVESVQRPDGIRGHSVLTPEDDQWWEWAPWFHGSNTNKLDVTLDMNSERGQALARRLIEQCDVVLENFAPRVMDQWGLDADTVLGLRPDVIYVRMPAFGLAGPWRDRTGYAQNMEQVSGMANMTGFADDRPLVPNGMCDPLAGSHAILALLLAVEHRDNTGEGMLVEVPMVGAAINVTAEQPLEYQAFGHLMTRDGNHGPGAAPQNLYECADRDVDGNPNWVAISVESDEQWRGLQSALGHPDWADDPGLSKGAQRVSACDVIDEELGAWCAARASDAIVSMLWERGVPVAKVLAGPEVQTIPQLDARGFLETVIHPLTGSSTFFGFPAKFSQGPERLHRRPAPMLGQHNPEVLIELLGLSHEELSALEADQVIGTRPLGQHRTR